MFDGHIDHSPEEIEKMIHNIIAYGEKYDVPTPYLQLLQKNAAKCLPL